jgi:hypothetical protein
VKRAAHPDVRNFQLPVSSLASTHPPPPPPHLPSFPPDF